MIVEPLPHGGALGAAHRRYPDAPTPWVDLSTGINPVPYPIGALDPACWSRLPERDAVAALEAVAADAYRAPGPDCVVAAPGVQCLIQLLPHVFPARTVAVVGPTYEEHAFRWRASDTHVAIVPDLSAIGAVDVVVVVNPNNPDGRLIDTSALMAQARSLTARGGLLVIDESFADVASPNSSVAPQVAEDRAIVLRSFGKFFGLAGLRLGFAIASPALSQRLRDALGPWAVSGPAVAIGSRALADVSWQADARRRLASDAARLDALLRRHDLTVIGGTSLFRLARSEHALMLNDWLCKRGILARVFAGEPQWIRFGIPGTPADGARLDGALADRCWASAPGR